MKVINYKTESFLKRVVYKQNQLIKAEYSLNEFNTSFIYLGKVKEKSNHGYIIQIDDKIGLYQKEDVLVGKHYLFKVDKILKDKYPILTREIILVSKYMLYGETLRNNMYLKTEAEFISDSLINKEYKRLKEIYLSLKAKETYSIKTELLYKYDYKNEIDSYSYKSLEEKILYFRKGEYIKEFIRFNIEKTKLGLIIDIDNLGQNYKVNEIAYKVISEILITMNVGGIIIIDFVGNKPFKYDNNDKRITYQKLSKNNIMEIIRKRKGVDLYDINFLELLADYIKSYSTTKNIEVNEDYIGVSEYLKGYNIRKTKKDYWFYIF